MIQFSSAREDRLGCARLMMETATQTEDRWEEKSSANYKVPSREDVKIPQAKSVSFDKVGTLYHINLQNFDAAKNVYSRISPAIACKNFNI